MRGPPKQAQKRNRLLSFVPVLGERQRTFVATLVVGALVAFALVSPFLVQLHNSGEGDGNVARQAVYIAILAMAAWAAYDGPYARLSNIFTAVPVPIWLALAWFAITVPMAIDPSIAARRLFLTVVIIWSICLAVRRAGYAKSIYVLRLILPALLAVNYLAVLVAPHWAIHHVDDASDTSIIGAWRGIMMQKNFAGAACAATIILFAVDAKTILPAVRAVIIAAAAVFLWQTHSKTSAAIVILAVMAGWLYVLYTPKLKRYYLIGAGVVCAAILVAAIVFQPVVASIMSNPHLLTGRVQIWFTIFPYWRDHPIFGSGYGSFWNIGPKSPILMYATNWVAVVGNGHNGYLDLLIQTGFLGLVFGAFAAFGWPLYRLFTGKTEDRPHSGLILAMLVFCALHNVTETSLFDRDSIVQVFLILAIALLAADGRTVARPTLADKPRKRRHRTPPHPPATHV